MPITPDTPPAVKPEVHVSRAAPHAGPRLGAHLSVAGGLHRALEAALALRCDTVQIFVRNQRRWHARPLPPAELARWHRLRAAAGLGPLVAHASYLINLATANRALRARSLAALAQELRRADTLAIPYLVIHPGAAGAERRERALARVAGALNRAFARNPGLRTMVLLETTAGQGTTLGRSFEELGAILGRLAEPQRAGVCIDTCHVFAAGYDIRRPAGYEAMVAAAAATVGLERVRCWHLNDSAAPCSARRDRHAHIGRGRLGPAAFRLVLGDARFAGLPMILETPKGRDGAGRDWDAVNLARLRRLAARPAGAGRRLRGRGLRSPAAPA